MTPDEAAERMVLALESIATTLKQAAAVPAPAAPEPCDHPVEDRLDFGLTNGQQDWQCRRCGFRSVEG